MPGELLSSERKRLGSNVFVSNGKIYSKVLGISEDADEKASVVPLQGKYMPQRDDVVIGVVSRVIFAGYNININSFAESFIPRSAMRDDLKMGDLVSAKVDDINELKEADLGFPRKMFGGEVIEVTPVRTPRLIGKNGSMLDLLRQGTGCEIIVGKNGRVWARGGNLELLRKVVEFIDANSFKSNLTNSVEAFFKAEGITVSAPKKESAPFATSKKILEEETEVLNADEAIGEEENEVL